MKSVKRIFKNVHKKPLQENTDVIKPLKDSIRQIVIKDKIEDKIEDKL